MNVPELQSEVPCLISSQGAAALEQACDNASVDIELIQRQNAFRGNFTGVVLLTAKDWFYKLPETVTESHDILPSLAEYFDYIVQRWLDDEDPEPRASLLKDFVYDCLFLDEMWRKRFQTSIRAEHQVLLDEILKSRISRSSAFFEAGFRDQHRQIRDCMMAASFASPVTFPQSADLSRMR